MILVLLGTYTIPTDACLKQDLGKYFRHCPADGVGGLVLQVRARFPRLQHVSGCPHHHLQH